MPAGPGKYDGLTTLVRERSNAVAVALVVIEGNEGTGFSVQTVDPLTNRVLPALLRMVADAIDAEMHGAAS